VRVGLGAVGLAGRQVTGKIERLLETTEDATAIGFDTLAFHPTHSRDPGRRPSLEHSG
jgi:hypothetical protein